MTTYHGGKQRLGDAIAKIIKEYSQYYNIRGYLEPFCGMLGVYQHVVEYMPTFDTYLAGDINKSVILMWKEAQRGWVPPKRYSEAQYNRLKGTKSSALKGFVGHACAQRGIYFAPYTLKSNLPYSSARVCAIANSLKHVKFSHGSYDQYKNLRGFIIYCDPPYYKSSRYYTEAGETRRFDHKMFYAWAEKMAKHNLVFISENSSLPYKLVVDFGYEKLYLV